MFSKRSLHISLRFQRPAFQKYTKSTDLGNIKLRMRVFDLRLGAVLFEKRSVYINT